MQTDQEISSKDRYFCCTSEVAESIQSREEAGLPTLKAEGATAQTVNQTMIWQVTSSIDELFGFRESCFNACSI